MKLNDQLFEDMSRLASGAASALSGLKDQLDPRRSQSGETTGISREEFEAVAAMASKAREVQEQLLKRIEALEQKLGAAGQPAHDVDGDDI